MYQHFIAMICLALSLIFLQGVGYAEKLVIGDFSSQAPGKKWPESWEPMTFSDIDTHTRYDLIQDKGRTVIQADSHNAASGLIRHVRVDPAQYPWLRWSVRGRSRGQSCSSFLVIRSSFFKIIWTCLRTAKLLLS